MTSDNNHNISVMDGVAIIGMAGRFPGASTIETFWQNLINGKESISFFAANELAPQVTAAEKNNPLYVPARGILEDIDYFDADFFGIPPLEATVMDPQHRMFLELSWEALEHAGCDPEQYSGLIGVFGGMNNSSYYLQNVLTRPDILDRVGRFQAMLANEKDFLTTRASYKLNLTGPSENINTACSTSLVAVIRGFQALMTYQCDMALAGGVSIVVPQKSGYVYQEGAMLSPDGHCRPFAEDAQGTTFNNGAGIVVLKRYDDALADQDHIFAVIRGTGLNNDGAAKVSFTAPGVEGQKEAIRMALAQAEVSPDTISYVEAHGTGTPLGDPIEVRALTQAFSLSPDSGKTCLLGSVKSNVGHLVHAAGVAGLIKTALSLERKLLPPTIHHQAPSPHIDWASNPFSVCSRLTTWPEGNSPRRAGVSSFGVGGTNAHVILEEHPLPHPRTPSGSPFHCLVLSARSPGILKRQARDLAMHLRDQEPDIGDVAFTLQQGRRHFSYRTFGVFRIQGKRPRFSQEIEMNW